ncbi:MAG TPA: LarC family nickel insertion protein [Chromatiaceae bacterium]|nr:MAG: hypothetical protein N838_12455 [Thiohalocapsa sp. PB-PSB1]HBG96137.1 LarC family nickel insertion protein [Chromatiaceae bacterium]
MVYRCIQVQRGTITCNVRFRRHPFSTIFKTSHFHLAIFIWPFSSGHFHLDSRMHYHLEPVGGIAGDMFAAAMLDQHRDWQDELATAIADSALADGLAVRALTHTDGLLSGHRFLVTEPTAADQEAHAHRHWSEIRELLLGSRLEQAVMRRAIAIFELLARAEAEVHGMPVEAISFHEVGAWDSIADIVSAAWLIERSGATSWSCSSIPLGRGRIEGAHGQLPVPAPATAALLRGFPVFDDGLDGERVTPTGAAILKYLAPTFGSQRSPRVLIGQGYGFGAKVFPGLSNILRVSMFDDPPGYPVAAPIGVCEFEVDDQTPEDLAVALDRLRELPGVLDVIQTTVLGKKGRASAQIRVLALLPQIDAIIDSCLIETTTLGVRWYQANRRTLAREVSNHEISGTHVRVKRAHRPDAQVTRKAEMDDLANAPGGHAGRERLRHQTYTLDRRASGDNPSNSETQR